ncbi:3-phosphoadenosine 5-phosphosulfate synthase-like protein 2 [Ochromonadaceae sp. CCMP2298]|nr:3-phosphoadenosine 5-phosphosulfate synthase-like protein 2 [Ochromonadaceae sp. CCMP2298]|mmetsp:Transcript_14634/g.32241  ORF Transcript_14634/g.32241 Transcript_14634/m.32241 type:complete len:1022 (+) Transcript_14634:104-3169(+)
MAQAKYSYAPLSTDANTLPSHGIDTSDNFTKKRDICLGFLILSAIVYVLARAGGSAANCPDLYVQQTSEAPFAGEHVVHNAPVFDIGAYREKILSQSTPHIIECIEAGEGGSQDACHLPREKRFAALEQKGVTLWMTGLSGSGKSTIAALLEEQLVLNHGKSVYRLDGDNIRTGLNRDLGFSKADRGESVRRVGELACLFADAGVITIVSLVSPYKGDRDEVRKRHEEQGLKFLEVFMDVPLKVVQERDPKGLYKKVAAGELKGFTGVDDPYEAPTHAEINMKNYEMTIQESVDMLFRELRRHGILVGGPTLPEGLPYPDGDEIIDLLIPEREVKAKTAEAETLPKVLLTDIDVNWLQTVAEGWAAPLKGFMREGALLQTMHFNSLLVDPLNITGSKAINEMQTNFLDFKTVPPKRVSMSVPIVLPITAYTKDAIEKSKKEAVTLMSKHGTPLAILRNPEIYVNRKEEIVSRIFGVIDNGHPYIKHIYTGGDWLLGGEIELLQRIKYNDGLDKFRLTAPEVMKEFEAKGADAVFAFQTRNPTHAGHAYLMKTGREILLKKGFSNPILWLSPLGGWTKEDDVPLDVRVKQHEAVLEEGMLDKATTVMAIWPAPMIYAGPTEVLFHAKSRRNAGATYFVAGRDPAGMKGSDEAVAHPDDDLYDGNHGRYVLTMSPGQDPMDILPFGQVEYDIRDHVMKAPDPKRPGDFISISGSKMRQLAAQGAQPCNIHKELPTDLLEANCIPPGFMVQSGWDIVCDYYQNVESTRWVPFSIMNVDPLVARGARVTGKYGTMAFELQPVLMGKPVSPWHDVSLFASEASELYNFIVEIPMYSTAKMEVMKDRPGNPIMQDTKDNAPRYYSYGTPFFNYGLLPQTWEDPSYKDPRTGAYGDGDPIDAIEIGMGPLAMGSIVPVKVLGSMELIDEGETDHKIIVLRQTDQHFDRIDTVADLERYYPGTVDRLVDWLKNYKTSDGKPQNTLTSDEPTSPAAAKAIITEVSEFYQSLILGEVAQPDGYYLPTLKRA